MASIMKIKLKRQGKATQAQIDFMVDYLVENPHVATGKFITLNGRDELRVSWEHLVEELNGLTKDGRTKDVKSWKSTWCDNKTAVSQKIAKIRKNRSQTGNVESAPITLTPRDEKILGLMGHEYVEGVQCPDSFPEGIPNAVELLAEGEVLNLQQAHALTVLENSESCLEFTDYELLIDEEADVREAIQPESVENAEAPPNAETEVTEAPANNPTASQGRISQPARARDGIRRRVRLITQAQDARNDFASLAERQISCMEMFATAMTEMAKNDRERNKILRSLVEAEKSRDKTIAALTSLVKDCVEVLNPK